MGKAIPPTRVQRQHTCLIRHGQRHTQHSTTTHTNPFLSAMQSAHTKWLTSPQVECLLGYFLASLAFIGALLGLHGFAMGNCELQKVFTRSHCETVRSQFCNIKMNGMLLRNGPTTSLQLPHTWCSPQP